MVNERSFGQTIRQLREARGLLLRQLASQLEVDTAFISKMERSEKKANKEHVEKLALILNVDIHKLMTIWLSDRLMDALEKEPNAISALKLTEQRLRIKRFKNA